MRAHKRSTSWVSLKYVKNNAHREKKKKKRTRGGSGFRDQKLAVKSRKPPENLCFFEKNENYQIKCFSFFIFLVMPQCGGKQYFRQKQKTKNKEEERSKSQC